MVKAGSSSLTTPRRRASTRDRIDALVDVLAARRAAGTRDRASSPPGRSPRASAPLGLPRRPRDLATQQAAASVGQGLLVARYTASFARHGAARRAGAADRRRHDAPLAPPQRPAHPGAAARPRRRADRQRERHRRHRRDPLRRQRPARRARRPPRPRGRAGPAVRRRRPLHRRPAPARRPPDRRGARPADLDGRRARRLRRGSAPAAWSPRSRPPGSRRRGRPGACSPTPRPPPRRSRATTVGTYFHPAGRRRRRPGCCGSPTPPPGRAGCTLDPGAVEAVVRRRKSLLPAGITGVEGDFAAGDPVDLCDADGPGRGARPGQLRRGGDPRPDGPLDPLARPRAGPRVRARDHPPRRPGLLGHRAALASSARTEDVGPVTHAATATGDRRWRESTVAAGEEQAAIPAGGGRAGRPPPSWPRCRARRRTPRCRAIADALDARPREIVEANAGDVERAREAGTADYMIDRLRARRASGSRDRRRPSAQVAALPDPVGEVVRGYTLPNGLELRQVRVPLGVVGIIYEGRPNVTVDAAAPVPEERQRRAAARLVVGVRLQHGAGRGDARALARHRAARRRRAARARREPRVGQAPDAGPRPGRRAHPARRRLPDQLGRRGVDGPGDRDRRRQLPRLRRRATPTSTWRSTS